MGGLDIKPGTKAAVKGIHIGVAGFESHSRAAMNLFFVQQEPLFTVVSLEQAEVLILDMEHPATPALVEQHQSLRPIVAVTATEKIFDGLVTISKPLNSKQLISAIQRAKQEFKPVFASQSGEQRTGNPVSLEGEKAFQEYQKRIAAGRQAIENFQQSSSRRESVSSKMQKQLLPGERIAGEEIDVSTQRLVSASQCDVSTIDQQILKPVAKEQALAVLPAGKQVAEKKPVEIKAKLSYQMIYECCGNAPDINMHEHEQRRRVFFKDDSTLLVMLQEAMSEADKQCCPVEVTGLPGALVYLPAQQRFLFDFPEELLIPLALTRFGYQELNLKNRPDFNDGITSLTGDNVKLEPGDELLWKIALWTLKGRLNKCVDPDKRCRLAVELDFNRLLATPHATTINSLWGRHSLSVLEVVKVLKINQRYVFSFMSAAQALGVFK